MAHSGEQRQEMNMIYNTRQAGEAPDPAQECRLLCKPLPAPVVSRFEI